jgi:plasmid stabilization system protein ParE
MRVIYHDDARFELFEAAGWYDDKLPGLGDQFLDEIEVAVREIKSHPQRFSIVEGDIRRYLVKRFPYAIYYRVHEDVLQILVIKHHRRHPDYWKYRK